LEFNEVVEQVLAKRTAGIVSGCPVGDRQRRRGVLGSEKNPVVVEPGLSVPGKWWSLLASCTLHHLLKASIPDPGGVVDLDVHLAGLTELAP